ncbi:hypothetical protein GCM10020220_070100 [Nonomuraea rubra]|uniref:aldo/keto reductase n=1 Tax=Nonomuraea rubra TaxID=46180 RepID=UPI0031EED851
MAATAAPGSCGPSRDSLRRLRTDRIDLYQIHRPDPSVDLDETLGALTDLVRAGKVRYIGCSTFPAHRVVESHWVAERRHRERFASEQPPYSILARAVEADLLPVCQQYGMGVLAWSPLAGGWLSGRYREGAELPQSRRAALLPARYDMELEENRRKLAAAERLALLAEQAGMSLVELALQFVMQHPAVTSAIIGPRTMDHLESHLRPLDVRLTPDVLDAIDVIVPPGLTINASRRRVAAARAARPRPAAQRIAVMTTTAAVTTGERARAYARTWSPSSAGPS